jgi:hypothetical protein
MKGFFLPNGEPTKLMPGDQIVFMQNRNDLEILEFYRRGTKLKFVFSPHQIVERIEFSRIMLHIERMKWAVVAAAIAGTNYTLVERGERRTVFQLVQL